jgi:hypothetical protein
MVEGLGPSGVSQLSWDDGVREFGLEQLLFGMRRKLGPGLRRGDSFEVGALCGCCADCFQWAVVRGWRGWVPASAGTTVLKWESFAGTTA